MRSKRMNYWILVGAITGIGCTTAIAAPPTLPTPEIEVMPNGLRVAWFLNDSLPVIDATVVVKTGYRHDPSGKSGTSELLTAVLDKGAAGLSAQDLAQSIEMLGATRYTLSDGDTVAIGVHGLAPDGSALLDFLAKITLQPDFPEVEVRKQKAHMLDAMTHLADNGQTLASLAMDRVLTAGTDYARGTVASITELKTLGRSDLTAFHQKYFTPAQCTLLVVGRIEKEVFRKKLLATFGQWKTTTTDTTSKPQKIPSNPFKRILPTKNQILLVERPDLSQAQIRFGLKAPLITSPDHYALIVGNALIGEYFNSRLNAIIRDKLGLTYSIGSGFSYNIDAARFTISSATRNETVGQLIQKTLNILRDLKNGNISEEEVQMAKEYLVGRYPLEASTLGAVASAWLAGALLGLPSQHLNEFIPRINAITKDDVIRALTKHLDLNQLVIIVAGDATAISKSLKDNDLKAVKRIQPADLL